MINGIGMAMAIGIVLILRLLLLNQDQNEWKRQSGFYKGYHTRTLSMHRQPFTLSKVAATLLFAMCLALWIWGT